MKVLAMFLFAAALFAQPDLWYPRARLGHQAPVAMEPQIAAGILVDASCDNRSALNLRQQPELAPAPLPQQSSGGVSAFGVTVDARTLALERAGVMEHHVPDLRMRQPDLTCAVTGDTRSFALLMDDGRLVNLDEGGNTMASEFLHADAAGRALLNGTGPALKPRVTIKGRIHMTRLVVEQFIKVGGPT